MTGDANPIHAHAEAAALMFTGGLIIHGVHGLMWSLDAYLRTNPGVSIRGLQATFLKPVRLDEVVEVKVVHAEEILKIKLVVAGADVTTAKVTLGSAPHLIEATLRETPFAAPPVRRLEELEGVTGTLTMPAQARGLTEKFPHLAAAIGPGVLVGLGSLATLVGMECPGLYGVSTDIAVDISNESGPLSYAVRRVDKRFARAEMDVRGYGLSGRVGAFVNEPRAIHST